GYLVIGNKLTDCLVVFSGINGLTCSGQHRHKKHKGYEKERRLIFHTYSFTSGGYIFLKLVIGGPTRLNPCSSLNLSCSASVMFFATPSLTFVKKSSIFPAG